MTVPGELTLPDAGRRGGAQTPRSHARWARRRALSGLRTTPSPRSNIVASRAHASPAASLKHPFQHDGACPPSHVPASTCASHTSALGATGMAPGGASQAFSAYVTFWTYATEVSG